MSFEEWWNTKDYPVSCKGNCKEAYEAGLHADVHTDNSAVIAELETQIAELKEAIKHFNPCGDWNDDVHDCEFRHYAMEYGSKLTKAKELLGDWLQIAHKNHARCYGFVKDTEQFLNSEVEK